MFEYLMPLLVMRVYPGTLLDETYDAVVERQIQYGAQRGVPWGISESAYYAQDIEGNYQYRAFGVPGLGLKRGLGRRSRRRAVCLPARRAAGAGRSRAKPRAAARRGHDGPLWILRSHRLHRGSAARGSDRRRRAAHLHGAPPGHEPALARQPAERVTDAEPFSCGSARPGGRPVAAGAGAASGAAEGSADRAGGTCAHEPPAAGARRPPLRDAAHPEPSRPPPVERVVHRDGDKRGRRIQPAPEPRVDPVARGHHDRCVGQLLLRPRSADRKVLVDDPSTERAQRRRIRSDVRARSRGLAAARRGARDSDRSCRVARGRCRVEARVDHESQPPAADVST